MAFSERPKITPIDPFPADGANAQSVNVFLDWEVEAQDPDLLSYNVILEANNPAPAQRLNSAPLLMRHWTRSERSKAEQHTSGGSKRPTATEIEPLVRSGVSKPRP